MLIDLRPLAAYRRPWPKLRSGFMSTKSYVVTVPMKTEVTGDQHSSLAAMMTRPDVDVLRDELARLFERIDAANESVVAVQTIQAGYGAYGATFGFGYTHSMVVITRTP
jgi:hypothetical protein